MTEFTRFKLFLWYFSRFKVPLLGYVKPVLISLDQQHVLIKIPLNRRTKNHLHSMYFGSLAAGADLAGGLLGFYFAKRAKLRISLAFKSFSAQFIKRAESEVYFICTEGKQIEEMIAKTELSSLRCNQLISVKAYTHYFQSPELVAEFQLELSIKKC